MRLTRAQRRTLESLNAGERMRRGTQGRTLMVLREAGLLANDPRTGAYVLTDSGRARVSGGS